MRTDISHTGNTGDTETSPRTGGTPGEGHRPGSRRRSVVVVIAGSLGAGAAAALILALVVFAGASENTITGSILLAFGLGWAMIAALSVRLTDQPQRWASVPAAAMTATGLGLMIFAPGNAGLSLLSWVWPPLMLALAIWITVQVRHALDRGGRWLLLPVAAVLVISAVGASYENLAQHHDQQIYTAPGTTYDVGGHRLHLDCRGTGGPTVVLQNGLGEISASWIRITEKVARTTRVCAYDRAGQGWSEDAESPQDGLGAAQDLHTLLARAHEAGPFVLVGHSTGGAYAMIYAARYPQQIAGLVLLDSSSPEQLTRIPSFAGQYAVTRRLVALLPTLARLGLGRVVAASAAPALPAPEADQVRALTATARGARNVRDEQSVIPQLFKQAQALTTFHAKPLAVVTASESLKTGGWAGAQQQLAALSTNRIHRVSDSTHTGLLEAQHGSADSVRAINDVIASVRTGYHLNTR
jgi:pimeloyl-ACP methyl ester carboxylesterase